MTWRGEGGGATHVPYTTSEIKDVWDSLKRRGLGRKEGKREGGQPREMEVEEVVVVEEEEWKEECEEWVMEEEGGFFLTACGAASDNHRVIPGHPRSLFISRVTS